MVDAPQDRAPASDGSPADRGETSVPLKPNGGTCYVGGDCVSGFCADGLCCNTACADACYTCAAVGVAGTCVPADVGTNPRGSCTDEGRVTCGNTGQCDGAGACQKYAAGTVCQDSGCTGSMLMSAGRCDGMGACMGATSTSCAPFQCNASGQCRTTCMADADCIAPNTCNLGSCGKKPVGATCGNDVECNSNFCAQGVCCSTACTGNCKSCGLSGSAGTCTNVPAGMDPLMQCADSGAMTCGSDGTCDGAGACHIYASTTVCGTASCTAGTGTLAGRCSGAGACQGGTLQNCSPYVCGVTACLTKCATTADCASGFVCNGTICGKKVTGVSCATAADCASGYCEQSICCNTGCAGTCMACNLTGTVGTCTTIAAGNMPNPATQCVAAAASTCGNDGACNGAGACRKFVAGTQCAGPTCVGSTLTSAGTCDGAGACRAGTSSKCDPFMCAANNACRLDCTTTATDCVSPNICMNNSCGKKPNGATCTATAECNSGNCSQGVCCATNCTGTCKSCALAGSVGTCANVPGGQVPTPATQCTDGGATTCGNDGTCNGSGACRNYVSGTQCVAGSCVTATYTPPRLCTGTGTCAAATSATCGAYACDTTMNICKTSCSVNGDCVSPNVCNGGTCSKKALGVVCATAAECNSGFCAQGVCCATACTGTCQSCALTGSAGTCTSVPTGQAPTPATQCMDAGVTTCGINGLCDGAGACQLYANGTACVAGSCTGSTLTPARTCDGAGVCRTVTSSLCDPYGCDSTNKVCKTTCTVVADCASPNTCIGSSCGSKPNGSTCAAGSECNSTFCAQNVCCSTACAGTCRSCAIAGSLGTCAAAGAGTDPLTQCTMAAASTCDFDGFCDGSGACRNYASGTQCAAATCTGNTLTPAASCNGTGTCNTPATVNCSPYLCGTGACKTTCASNADCLAPNFVCVGTTCSSATMLDVKLKTDPVGTQWITLALQIKNNGTTAVPLSDLTVRYWYTYDTTPVVAQAAGCNYAQTPPANCANVNFNGPWTAVSPAKTGADFYYQVGFGTAAGNLNAGATAEFQVQFHKNDWTNFTQTGDYSYNASTSFATTTKVTVYRLGTLVYGTEPP